MWRNGPSNNNKNINSNAATSESQHRKMNTYDQINAAVNASLKKIGVKEVDGDIAEYEDFAANLPDRRRNSTELNKALHANAAREEILLNASGGGGKNKKKKKKKVKKVKNEINSLRLIIKNHFK